MIKVQYLGKNLKGEKARLAERLKVTQADIDILSNNEVKRYFYNNKTGEVSKANIKESPLLIRNFGIKRINNKQLIEGGLIKKDTQVLVNDIPLNKKLTGMITMYIRVLWASSGHTMEKDIYINVVNEVLIDRDNIIDKLMDKFIQDYNGVWQDIERGEAEITHRKYKFIGKNNVVFNIKDMKLKGKHLDLTKIYGENVELIETKENCVRDYLFSNYHKKDANGKVKGIGKKPIEKLGNENGVSANEIYDFCVEYNIKCILFNVEGNIIKSHYPVKKNKQFKNLIGICYNNHFYPLKNQELNRIPNKKVNQTVFSNDLFKELTKILNDGSLPSNIGLNGEFVTNIQVDDIMYHSNEDYDICNKILTKLGLKDKMNIFVNKINISDYVEKLFIKSSIDSFYPYNSNEGGFNFFNEDMDDEDFTTIDHNKHYSDALRKLNRLIVVDIKTAKHIIKPKLIDNYFYIAKPKYSNILMPRTGYYSYDFLSYCEKEGVEFELLEGISCEYKENYYCDMINTLYSKLDKDDFKAVINCMIGKFEKKSEKVTRTKFIKIANKDETDTTDKYIKKINDEYNIIYDIVEMPNNKIYNRVPIRVQALCEARKIVYEKMKELKLNNNNIKQIRTDAITFIKSNKRIRTGYEMGEWKNQESVKYFNKNTEIYDIDLTFKLKPVNDVNTIYIDYAGSGKTHFIINKLIPKLNNYIVLSPSHASIREYRSNKINCNVIQKYLYNHEIPSEQNIIIDEIGMLDTYANNILIKCVMSGKNIYSFGDFKQLKPVASEICNNNIYLNYMYRHIKSLGTNYRNNFSKEYYDKLFNMTNKKEILNEIKKWNTDKAYKADTIICYRNDTRKEYNKKMCEKLGIKFGDIGCKVVCNTNDLRDKDIYNNFYYTIKDNKDKIIISDGVEEKELTVEEFNKNFELGYCRTLYNIQGESIKSFHFCLEDADFIDGRALYTLISRLKQEIKVDKDFIVDLN